MNVVRSSSAAQGMRLKRFALGFATYLLMLGLGWLAILSDASDVSIDVARLCTVAILLSQGAFLLLYSGQWNLNFRDPGMTVAQIVVGILCVTAFLGFVDQARGTLLLGYLVALLFGITRLSSRSFRRCAAFAFICFALLTLFDTHYRLQVVGLSMLLLQLGMLALALTWLTLFARHVQVMQRRMQRRSVELQAHQQTLRGMMAQLEEMVATDELTGLFNRRHFMRLAHKELQRLRASRCHGLALIDLDHFKRVNDVFGHATGDHVLQVFAEVAKGCLRDGDVLARYGGEEFVLLIPDTDPEQFALCCERVRSSYAAAVIPELDGGSVSLSIGMTLLCMHDDLENALNLADQALYRAKEQGRNRCCASWEEEDGQASTGRADVGDLVRQ